jgi:hypothetical protein
LGKAVCKNGATIIVANYDPRGNMMGEKPYWKRTERADAFYLWNWIFTNVIQR